MKYRKPKIQKLPWLFLVIGLLVAIPVQADTFMGRGTIFKGPASTCVSHTTSVYPCVSLSPPAYQPRLAAGIMSASMASYLPLDAGRDTSDHGNWLTRMLNGDIWKSQLRDIDMGFTMDESGAAIVNMQLGGLKFNVNVDDSRFSESRVFLGIDRHW